MGYGSVNVKRVLGCTEQRGSIIGFGEIEPGKAHEYRLPLPYNDENETNQWRRMTMTLAWFSPINPYHRNMREAKLSFKPSEWAEELKIKRRDCDYNQVARGTVQHEILESSKPITNLITDINMTVTCKADATEQLDQSIPYGLAVT